MAIKLKRYLRDRLVYWAKKGSGGQGQSLFEQPVEVRCRWDDASLQEVSADNRVVTYAAMIMLETSAGVKEQGLVYQGTLEDVKNVLKVAYPAVPGVKQGVREIKRIERHPDLKTKPLLTIAYL